MPFDIAVSFRHMDISVPLETQIRERAAELAQFSDRIVACRVTVEPNTTRHRHGNTFHVRIELSVPGDDIVIDRDPGNEHAHDDPYLAVRDAFHAARRRLQDHMRRLDGKVKTHDE